MLYYYYAAIVVSGWKTLWSTFKLLSMTVEVYKFDDRNWDQSAFWYDIWEAATEIWNKQIRAKLWLKTEIS